MVLSAAIAAVFTVSSIVNMVADGVGAISDQVILGESLATMNNTTALLKQKALAEKDPVKRDIKMKMAEKLAGVHDALQSDRKGSGVGEFVKTGANTGKMILGEIAGEVAENYVAKNAISELGHYGALQAGKAVATPVAIVDGVLDAALMARNLLSGESYDPSQGWSSLAHTTDGIDTQIEMIKARDLRQKTDQLGKDIAEMMRAYGMDPDNPEASFKNDNNETPPEPTPAPVPIENDPPVVIENIDDVWNNGDEYGPGDYGYNDDVKPVLDVKDVSEMTGDYYDNGLGDQYTGWNDYYGQKYGWNDPDNNQNNNTAPITNNSSPTPPTVADQTPPQPTTSQNIETPVVDNGPCDPSDPLCGLDTDGGW